MSDALSRPVPGQWKRNTLFSAISASLAAGSPLAAHAQSSGNEAAESSAGALEEVTVTARKREENIQDIPQSIQAFSQMEIDRSGIKSLADIAKFAPAMTVVGSTAGLNKIVFRGLADSVRPYIADSSAAIYLDEQPLTTGAQSPEIRPIDLERVEVLSGPQGTLYGASSQSGTIRYIVAKPDVSAFSANVGGGVNTIDHGGTGWDADAMVNIPLIEGKLAIRLVGFGAKDAGFIDNVLAHSPGHIDWSTGEVVPGNKTNADIVDNNINSADWKGGRISAKWLMTDSWALTGIYNYSDSKIHGYTDFDPTTGDLKTIKFHRESWDDNWSNFQLTLDGDMGIGQLTSSLAYFERDTAYVFDGTSGVAYYHSVLGYYGRGTCGSNPYYAYYNIYDFATACELNGVGYDVDNGDPTGFWRNDQRDTRWTFETRLTGSTSRWDWTLGFFYQEAKQHWVYGTYIDDYTQTESWAAYNTIWGPLEPTDVRWASAERNKRKDTALFGEATYSITDQWKLLLGARWYKADVDRTYTLSVPGTAPPDISQHGGKDDGFLPKLGFQYFFAEDRMIYALYSEGFRAGGINRSRGNPTLPIDYKSDLLENWEAGLKSRWAGGKLQFNVTGYHQIWKDMQLELVDPSWQFGEPWQTVVANVGDAIVDGMDVEINVAPAEHWSLGATATYLFKAEIDNAIQVFDDRAPEYLALDIPAGTRLPLTADLNLSAFAQYDWSMDLMGGGNAYLRLQYAHTGSSWNSIIDNDGDPNGTGYGGRVKQPAYDLWDLRAGYNTGDWDFGLYVDNFTDERAVTYHYTGADLFWGRDNIRTLRPRTYGINVRRYFR
ncbi:MAG: TonB-dependent receptor [Lysobacterales bacterium]|jgi:outer membrane receptor protein involved in Fe transport